MELTWVNKLRIAAVAALGIIVIGVLAWPLAAPEDPMLPVRAGGISLSVRTLLVVLAFVLGFGGYFVAWPHGREIGILTVPFGLAVWAARSGPMRTLMQAYVEPFERTRLAHSLRFEPAYWLLLATAGFAGVLIAQRLRPVGQRTMTAERQKRSFSANACLNALLGVAISVPLSQFFVGVFVQNLHTSGNTGTAQPAIGQIVFGVTAAFGVAAFVAKRFLDLSYVWPSLACLFVIALTETVYYNSETIQRFAEMRPATFFPHSVLAVLPIQLVAFGTIGSVIGYWTAVRYDFWRKHESAG
jgi:hypothetical protein